MKISCKTHPEVSNRPFGNKELHRRLMHIWRNRTSTPTSIGKYITWLLSLKPGDIVHSCNGFNNKIKSIEHSYWYDVLDPDPWITNEHGESLCHISGPAPYEEILKYQESLKDFQNDEWGFYKKYKLGTLNADGTFTPGED